MIIKKQFYFILGCLIVLLILSPLKVFSHAVVVKEVPAENSVLDEQPEEIVITFGSEVEDAIIRLVNGENRVVFSKPANISDDGLSIFTKVSDLPNGMYMVEYTATSVSDGHFMTDAYYFQIGNDTTTTNDRVVEQESNNLVYRLYFLRAIYYIGLLTIVGWLFWWWRVQEYSKEFKERYLLYGFIAQMLHIVGLMLMILMQLNILTSKGIGSFTLTSQFELLWLLSLSISILGFFLFFRYKWLDFLIITILLVTKSFNSHSYELDDTGIAIFSNGVHLLVASIWISGILIAILFWKKYQLYVQQFLLEFRKLVLLCFALLGVTGLITTLSFITSTEQLFSSWGVMYGIKLIAVVIVMIVGVIIHFKIKKDKTVDIRKWFVIEMTLIACIMLVVAILTYLNPLS